MRRFFIRSIYYFVAAIAVSVCAMLLVQKSAQASWTVCNDFPQGVIVSVAYPTAASGWHSYGMSYIDSKRCRVVLSKPIRRGTYYMLAYLLREESGRTTSHKISWEGVSPRSFCLGWNKTVGPDSARLDLELADRSSTCNNAGMAKTVSTIGMRLMWLPYYPFEKRDASSDWQYHIGP